MYEDINKTTIDQETTKLLNEAIKQTHLCKLIANYILNFFINTLEHLALIILVYSIVCLSIYNLLSRHFGIVLINRTRVPRCERVLIITAHPDDECMFFGPTILTLNKRQNCNVFLLCLSNGNFEKKGNIRSKELWNASKKLFMSTDNITLLNATNLQDDPNIEWKVETIAKYILKEIETLDIDLMITFDRDGISHHPNHCAIYYATASLCLAGLIPKTCKVMTLDSIHLCRKYISLFDLPASLLLSNNWCILTWDERRKIQNAMKEHKSQLTWYRKLYIIFSRYMMINSLQEMSLSDIELEMQIADL